MKRLIYILVLINFCTISHAQNLNKKAVEIMAEGKMLYQLEMASWHGTDLFVDAYDNMENVGGYFSYPVGKDSTQCIFYDKKDSLE